MNRILELAGLFEEKSEAEYDQRDKMISKIEGYCGTLETVPYSKISTADLKAICDALAKQKQVKDMK